MLGLWGTSMMLEDAVYLLMYALYIYVKIKHIISHKKLEI
jgi:hypothetical protein